MTRSNTKPLSHSWHEGCEYWSHLSRTHPTPPTIWHIDLRSRVPWWRRLLNFVRR